jgi:hypothetical protein
MGMVSSGALASMVLADKNMMWNVPEHWTLEDAATVCCVYGTVSCHEVKSKLENVLFISRDLRLAQPGGPTASVSILPLFPLRRKKIQLPKFSNFIKI